MRSQARFSNCQRKDRCEAVSVRGRLRSLGTSFSEAALAAAVAVLMTGLASAAPRVPAKTDRSPAKVIESYFATLPGYQKGDLITRSQIEKVIAKLEVSGTKVPNAGAIAKSGMADDSFLVREFATAEGRRFMRKMSQRPGMYAYLDRLSTIPRGQTIVHDLIGKKDGDKFVEYLATTKGGHNMGSMMAHTRGGTDLNTPTGRIYTADDLIAAFKGAMAKQSP
jgi:hypothetical protein